MRWATAPNRSAAEMGAERPTYTACVIDAVGSAGLQSQACNEFEETTRPKDGCI